jgi:diadenosine tetraphosphatase ApaH/serine/threonine PP2A family protein phosphatase
MESTIDVSACEKMLINVGSVGQPRDENPKAAYAVFDTDERKVWIKRVAYDVDAAIRAIEQNKLPRILGERLRLGK